MAGKPVAFHPEALAEAEAAVAWYRDSCLPLGYRPGGVLTLRLNLSDILDSAFRRGSQGASC